MTLLNIPRIYLYILETRYFENFSSCSLVATTQVVAS